jgi:hypothetical protein
MSSEGQSKSFVAQGLAEDLPKSFFQLVFDVAVFAFFLTAIPISLLVALVLTFMAAIVLLVLSVAYDPASEFAIWTLSMTPLLASALVGFLSEYWLYPHKDDDGVVSETAIGDQMWYPSMALVVPAV